MLVVDANVLWLDDHRLIILLVLLDRRLEKHGFAICHETIYRYAYQHGQKKLCQYLPPQRVSTRASVRFRLKHYTGKRLKSGEALASEENDETNQASQPPICAPARGPPDEVIDHHDDEWSQRLGIEEKDRDQRNWC